MTITAVIKRPNLIVANTVPLTTTQSNPPIDLKNSTSVGQNYVHNLLDVFEDHPQDGYTLVYNGVTHKYDVKPIIAQVQALDGGNF